MPAPGTDAHSGRPPRVAVFAPSVMLTVTVEDAPDAPEVHLHAGGQGFWIARLASELGVEVSLVGPFGGEAGTVLRGLVADTDISIHSIPTSGTNGVYVHDRRSGERVEIAEMPPSALSRHEVDELYGAALVEGLESDVCVLAGPGLNPILPPEIYERLAGDLRANDKTVVADLSGEPLEHALNGGLSLLKVSADELVRDGDLSDDSRTAIVSHIGRLIGSGADAVVVTLAEKGLIAFTGSELVEIDGPSLQAVETRGAGDSLTAGTAAALAWGASLPTALRIGAAAGALNVTRRGLGTGARDEIERLAEHIELRARPLNASETASSLDQAVIHE